MHYSIKEEAQSVQRKRLSANKMEVGQLGKVVKSDRDYIGHILLRTYDSIVSLNNPIHTWTATSSCCPEVELLPSGKVIKLVVS